MLDSASELIIFSSTLDLLGEVTLDRGACIKIFLNSSGEKALGQWFEEWQTQGILHTRIYPDINRGMHEYNLVAERTQMRSPDFADVLRTWLLEHKYHSLTVPASALTVWHLLCDLDLHSAERYMLGAGIRHKSPHELAAWETSLQDMLEEQQASKTKTKKTVRKRQKS